MTRRDYPHAQGAPGTEKIFEAEDFNGNVLFAVATQVGAPTADTCFGVTATFGVGSLALWMGIVSEIAPPQNAARIAWAPLADPSLLMSTKVAASDFGRKPMSVAQSGDGRVLIQTEDYSYGMLDTANKTVLPSVGNYPPMLMARPVLGGAIVLDYSEPSGIGFLSNDNALTNLYRPQPGHQVTAIGLDRSDSDRIVWVESTSVSPALDTVYWTAPFSKTSAAFVPRRITAFDDKTFKGGVFMAADIGLIVNYDRFDRVLLTKISDGWSWEMPALAGEYFSRAIWVDENYVYMARAVATTPSGKPENGMSNIGMVRFSRSSLGAPTIPPQ